MVLVAANKNSSGSALAHPLLSQQGRGEVDAQAHRAAGLRTVARGWRLQPGAKPAHVDLAPHRAHGRLSLQPLPPGAGARCLHIVGQQERDDAETPCQPALPEPPPPGAPRASREGEDHCGDDTRQPSQNHAVADQLAPPLSPLKGIVPSWRSPATALPSGSGRPAAGPPLQRQLPQPLPRTATTAKRCPMQCSPR
jgi:hypothetical protein